ncbi:alkaline phosphatase family protein [Leifsonia sp. AG29]|uniref:alkaline phosphatase family protein n=1 Tax=Leifsonia sp. AG29 TaxID=2598860 RepID=UPI00131CCA85|nr:alkaline phosphatase family protein [Leifsonia sp. AG29]
MARRAITASVAGGLLALALALTACTGTAQVPETPTPQVPTVGSAHPSPAATGGATSSAGALAHVVVIVDENKPASSIIGNPQAPYLASLASQGAVATHYSAITHPSLPNYLALTSGTTAGITSDCNPPGGSCLDTAPNLAQALDRAGRSWRMYAESMPSPCSPANTDVYAVKHNPFLYFPSVTSDSAYCASHDVPYSRFAADLASPSTLPDFSFISPDLCHDMHDCSVATGDSWLAANVPRILASPAFTRERSLLVVTFDEGDSSDNVVPLIFAGPAARPHASSSQPFSHYSLLRTIEDQWGLPPLGPNDGAAAAMPALLR